MAMLGRKLGKKVILIAEKLSEIGPHKDCGG